MKRKLKDMHTIANIYKQTQNKNKTKETKQTKQGKPNNNKRNSINNK